MGEDFFTNEVCCEADQRTALQNGVPGLFRDNPYKRPGAGPDIVGKRHPPLELVEKVPYEKRTEGETDRGYLPGG